MNTPKIRMFAKIVNHIVLGLMSVIMAIVGPRSLGPSDYGNFHFLRNILTSFVNFLDLNGSIAFFSYSSKNPNSKHITNFHTFYLGIVCLVFFISIMILFFFDDIHNIFPNQKWIFIGLASLMVIQTYIISNLVYLSDSKEATVGFEKIRSTVTLISIAIISFMYFSNHINLKIFFFFYLLMNTILIFSFITYLTKYKNYNFNFSYLSNLSDIRSKINYYYKYSSPLVFASFISFIVVYFDRWLLEFSSGSIEQGFYSLAFQISTISILITSSVTPVYQQEISKAHGKLNLLRIQNLFQKAVYLYLLSTIFSIFLFFNADSILKIVAGEKFKDGVLAMQIMMFYPIHQTMGRITGGTLLAMERTDLYRNIIIMNSFAGLVLAYFLLAPKGNLIPGLHLASFGLSIKMVLQQLIQVNFNLFYCCKVINQKFTFYFFYQFLILIPILISGWVVNKITLLIFPYQNKLLSNIGAIVFSAVLYSLIILLISLYFAKIKKVNLKEIFNK